MASRDAFSRSAMLALYRKVLKLHKNVLPKEMRELGDSYARSEFKAHKKAQIGQVKAFAKEWKEYVYTIELQAHQGSFGRELDPSKISALSEEQLRNLQQLEAEAKKLGGGPP